MTRLRENEPPMADPLAYFLTWSTYGTWLPGDERGWIEHGRGWQLPDPVRKLEAEARMTEDACRLDEQQRRIVEEQVAETCAIRGWRLHAVNCRSNHMHVVVTANVGPKTVRNQLKAWCTRRLRELEISRRQLHNSTLDSHRRTRSVSTGRDSQSVSHASIVRDVSDEPITGAAVHPAIRENWWAERGSQRFINDEDSLEAAVLYVRDGQDKAREHQPEA
jgi:REP element-mobilizing transposase RayT